MHCDGVVLVKIPPAIVSIHDVQPDVLDEVENIVQLLKSNSVSSITLLVIPGKNWSDHQIEILKQWGSSGLTLAGHGWAHYSGRPRNWKHLFHSVLLSKDQAEHLAKSRDEIITIIQNCYNWFQMHNLKQVKLYVPPAWGIGPVKNSDLDNQDFRYFEYLTGIYDSQERVFKRIPVVGFEADNRFRKNNLQFINSINIYRAIENRVPLRIAIHPNDFSLGLSDKILPTLNKFNSFIDYEQLFEGNERKD